MYTDNKTVKEILTPHNMEQPLWIIDATPAQMVQSEQMVKDITEMIANGYWDKIFHWEFLQKMSAENNGILREHRNQLFRIHLERKQSLRK